MSDEEGKSTSDRRLNSNVMDGPPGSEKTDTVAKRPKSPPRRRSKSRSRSRSFERRRSRSYSPDFRRGGRRRFFRRSRSNERFRGRFRDRSRERDRFYPRRSRSRSRSRSRGRRFDRRNQNSRKSPTPPPPPQYQQQPPAPPIYNDPNYAAYPGYMPPNTYTFDYTNAYPPPAPSFIQQTPAAPMILPGAPGDEFMGQSWAPMVNVPPPVIPEPQIQETEEEKSKREEAVKMELQTQKEALRNQRDEYLVRSQNLKRELKVLKQKRADLLDTQSGNPPSPRTNSFVKENDKLQSQIQNKLNTIMNVIDMLNGLIGNESDKEDIVDKNVDKKQMNSNESSPERLKTELLESMNKNKDKKVKTESDDKKRVNYVYYDPELHWCKCCSVFPKTAKDYLNHLQSTEHTKKQGEPETPWRDNLPEPPKHHSDAVTKRTPIRGLQFFVPSPAWYCKLCSFWMGDLTSASAHLKSELHSEKYNEFILSNPSYEVDWMSQRQHAYDYYRENESTIKQDESQEATDKGKSGTKFDQIPLNIGGNNHHPTIVIKAPLELPKKDKEDSKKRKKKKKDEKNKKKKKRSKKRKNRDSSSSSSSDSDSDSSTSDSDKEKSKEANANSIRVAMRKFLGQAGDDPKSEAIGKWTMVPPPPAISETQIKEKKRDELMIQQWMEPSPIISQDEKKLLEQLKGRLKTQGKEPAKSEVVVNKEREKEKSRDHEVSRDRRGYRRNSPRGRNSVSRSPGRDRGRRSRSRSYDRRRHRRYSRSRSRSRSRSKSHSRSRRVEKPVVHFPSEPKLPPLRERDREDAKKGRNHKRDDKDKSAKSSSTSLNKKLPFIGRMPVFKKQQIDKKQEIEPEKPPKVIPKPTPAPQEPTDMEVCEEEDMDAQYMPDPLQFSALMGAPPPPPMPEQPKIEEILPPGIDETEHDLIPKPISDAPIPRKGPLPQDFQETLNILFDGDKPKPVPEVKKPEVTVSSTVEHSMHMDNDSVHMMTAEDVYSQFSSPFVPAPPAPPSVIPNEAENHHEANSKLIPGEIPIPDKVPLSIDDDMIEEDEKDEKHNGIDLDELALLGIDANDLCMTSITMK